MRSRVAGQRQRAIVVGDGRLGPSSEERAHCRLTESSDSIWGLRRQLSGPIESVKGRSIGPPDSLLGRDGFELTRHGLIWPEARCGSMPRAAARRVFRKALGQQAMRVAPLVRGRRRVYRGSDQWVTKGEAAVDFDQADRFRRAER